MLRNCLYPVCGTCVLCSACFCFSCLVPSAFTLDKMTRLFVHGSVAQKCNLQVLFKFCGFCNSASEPFRCRCYTALAHASLSIEMCFFPVRHTQTAPCALTYLAMPENDWKGRTKMFGETYRRLTPSLQPWPEDWIAKPLPPGESYRRRAVVDNYPWHYILFPIMILQGDLPI